MTQKVSEWCLPTGGSVWRGGGLHGRLNERVENAVGGPLDLVSGAETDDHVFGVGEGLNRLFVVSRGQLYLLLRPDIDDGAFNWRVIASTPVPKTWEEARYWLLAANRMAS